MRPAERESAFAGRPAPVVSPMYANAFYLWASTAVASLSGLGFWALAARLYGAEEVGLGAAMVSALMLLATLSTLGLGMGLIRFLPESGGGGRLIDSCLAAAALAGALAAAVFLAGTPVWSPELGSLLDGPLAALGFVGFAAAMAVAAAQPYAFMAARKTGYVLAQVSVTQAARFGLAAALVALGGFGIAAAAGLAAALATAVGFGLLARGLPGYRPRPALDVRSLRRLLPFSIANHAADVLLLAPGLVLTIVVVDRLGSEQAAYFYMAWFLGYLLASASAQLSLSLFAVGSYRPEALRELSRKAAIAGLAIAAAGGLPLLLAGDRVLLLFGPEYAAEGSALLRVMAAAALPAAVLNVYLGSLRVMKRSAELVLIAAAVAVTTVGLSYVLLPEVGLEGAGIAFAAAQGLGLAMMLGGLLLAGEGTAGQRLRYVLSLAGRPSVETSGV
jgi:O-antigen/teichoic acid export membrane protein